MLPEKELEDTGRKETTVTSKAVNENNAKKEYNMEDLLVMFCSGKSWTPWTLQEDETLTALVKQLGSRDWQEIAKRLSTTTGTERLPKSCRQRWTDQLDPKLNHRPFTLGESELVVKYQKVHGNHWSLIASKLGDRSANMVKNHWYSLKRKLVRIKTLGSIDFTRGSTSNFEMTYSKESSRTSECCFREHLNDPLLITQARPAVSQIHDAQVHEIGQFTRPQHVTLNGSALPTLCKAAGTDFGKTKMEEPSALVALHMQTDALQGFPATAHCPVQFYDQQYACVTLNLMGTSRVPLNPKLPRL